MGGHPASAKAWKGLGTGVFEIVEDDRSGTYRAVYTVRFRKAVYVLHAFQKKSPSGIRTARRDVDLVAKRLNAAKDDYEYVMAKKRIEIKAGSDNVFADLGYADANERRLKVELALEVNRALDQRGLTQAKAAKILGVRQPHVSDLARYRLSRFSVERLMEFLTQLGRDVEIRITQRPAGRARSTVRVHHVA